MLSLLTVGYIQMVTPGDHPPGTRKPEAATPRTSKSGPRLSTLCSRPFCGNAGRAVELGQEYWPISVLSRTTTPRRGGTRGGAAPILLSLFESPRDRGPKPRRVASSCSASRSSTTHPRRGSRICLGCWDNRDSWNRATQAGRRPWKRKRRKKSSAAAQQSPERRNTSSARGTAHRRPTSETRPTTRRWPCATPAPSAACKDP